MPTGQWGKCAGIHASSMSLQDSEDAGVHWHPCAYEDAAVRQHPCPPDDGGVHWRPCTNDNAGMWQCLTDPTAEECDTIKWY